ncbi:MAG: heavy metal-binding domain-containing protein [Methylovulum sp.]|nr:heavy metal-binding domain-containing protein [Methylovulum sp.]MDD5126052.1 heavy metal-binding domain-containing protein [Methylovulum sp.]
MENNVLILTINDCPGMRVVRVIGPVYGTGVRSRNIVGNLLGGIRSSSAENRVVISK